MFLCTEVSQYIEYLFRAPNLGDDDDDELEVEEELRGQGQDGRGDQDRVPDSKHQHHRHKERHLTAGQDPREAPGLRGMPPQVRDWSRMKKRISYRKFKKIRR